MSSSSDKTRLQRLNKVFYAATNGKQEVTKQTYKLFIESIHSQIDAPSCIDKLRSSSHGLKALQSSLRFDLTPPFFNGPATSLLDYLSTPDIATIAGGDYLDQIVVAIAEPPIFWSAYKDSFLSSLLSESAQLSFAWLLHRLVQLPGEKAQPYREEAKEHSIVDTLLQSSSNPVRTIAHNIKHILDTCAVGATLEEYGPGGRHDNDFADFRQIAILPSPDEVMSRVDAFMRTSGALELLDDESRVATHLDNQYRLLREDMLYEMREELSVALGTKKGKYRGQVVNGLGLVDVHYETNGRPCGWGLVMRCQQDFWQFKKVKANERRKFLSDNRNVFKHGSMTCLLINGQIVSFPSVDRDEELLAKNPPQVVLRLSEPRSAAMTLKHLLRSRGQDIKLLQIDTAVFAYEPVLSALKRIQKIDLSPELLLWTKNSCLEPPPRTPVHIIESIKGLVQQDLQSLLKTPRTVRLDVAQTGALLLGLSQRVSLIQGPPGTGKSFIGALLAKIIHDTSPDTTILVVCYTNHALDQFLEDLLDIGIPQDSLARLGGQSTTRTEPFSIQKLLRNGPNYPKFGKSDWQVIDSLKADSQLLRERLVTLFRQYHGFNPPFQDVLDHLEFEGPEFFCAFEVPQTQDGMNRVDKSGKNIGPTYLIQRWSSGGDAGIFRNSPHVMEASKIWSMPKQDRTALSLQWKEEMAQDLVEQLSSVGSSYNNALGEIDRKFNEKVGLILRNRRIIGCTTTAAAKYCDDLKTANPGVLLVEEAGEILEGHILTALGPQTRQLILIGDHKQLRPKVSNYRLTVEKGEGYDLNRSLFERLVLKGYPHATLSQQHRMRTEISALVRHLTYPELKDAPGTLNRPDTRGLRDNVVFINHTKPEDEDDDVAERRDITIKSSKRNKYEVEMVLKIVRYLGQQGYGTDKIVILVPYLAQLRLLRDALKEENDPVLNDLDSYDLVRAGLLSPSAATLSKKPIRLATIDNYQGEESQIVIVSLTRSNPDHDIGFMYSPERVNVLLSRARDTLIMIGNAETFQKSRKGSEAWEKLIDILGKQGHIYEGLPIRCERHNDRTALLSKPEDFDRKCPDGGCPEPCNTILNCGLHRCPSRCHQLSDHSKMKCEAIMYFPCPKNHTQRYMCHNGPPLVCINCDRDKKRDEKKKHAEFLLQEKRDEAQRKHDAELAKIDAEIVRERDALRDVQLAEERKRALEQKLRDLEDAKRLVTQASRPQAAPTPIQSAPAESQTSLSANPVATRSADKAPPLLPKSPQKPARVHTDAPAGRRLLVPPESASRKEWERQKNMEGASNDALDDIMDMVGLEKVKEEILIIKATLDLARRQGTSITRDRYNVCMLGNPGTGKTTVARHYGKFLASVQVISGNLFVETTGSRLANDGIPGVKKMIEDTLKAGGGTIFVDEAYQLTSQHNYQGGQVLDFLLAEMENQVGKIAFIFAGYNREMEKFFEHNPGLNSRVPFRFQFKDYEDSELLGMLEKSILKYYSGRLKIDDADGIRGLYGRIAIRRLGRGRGREGFGNARALENMFALIRRRQGARIQTERKAGKAPDDLLLVKEDLIGPDPSQVVVESESWKKLQSMIGLHAVKQTVKNLFDMSFTNYQRELQELEPQQISLNRVFIGNPGTGKTTVAKLYGQILAELGLISNGEVVIKNPSDFIGSALGQSESQTKAILANTVGKVLIIDEAYMLYGGSGSGTTGTSDPYKTAVIDTIVAEVQSTPGEDRCVLLLGYKAQIEEMFQNVNPGLKRRFALEDAFQFDDYSDSELRDALDWKLKVQDLTATDVAKDVAIDVLSRARNRPNFGNIGEVENMLSQAKTRFQKRQASLPASKRSPVAPFEPEDFDPDFKRGESAAINLAKLFEDVVGCEDTIKKLGEYQQMARSMKALGMDPRDTVPTNFVFKGPPGTGKTTTARKMGQVYYDMGFLSSTEVIECSASDLVGQYVGQTGPKTHSLFEKALGKVLFVDEAYRLSEGHFAKEAMDELVGILTQETFRGKLIVILAGYDREMNELLAVNSGLSSRFPDEIVFNNMSPDHCLQILRNKLKKRKVIVKGLEDATSPASNQLTELIRQLSELSSWGNARDIDTLSKKMVTRAFTSLTIPSVSSFPDNCLLLREEDAVACAEAMLSERRERVTNIPASKSDPSKLMELIANRDPPVPPVIRTAQTTTIAPSDPCNEAIQTGDGRDPGVSDEAWQQLQADKKIAEEEEVRIREEAAALEKKIKEARSTAEKERRLQERLRRQNAKDDAEKAELMRQREQARLREAAARAEQAKAAAEREARRREEEKKRKEEARVQMKIRELGLCVAGFRWIKQSTGYRCAGGSHFLDNATLGISG